MLVSHYIGKIHFTIHENPFNERMKNVVISTPYDKRNHIKCNFDFTTLEVKSNKLFFYNDTNTVFEVEFGIRSEMLKIVKELKGLKWLKEE